MPDLQCVQFIALIHYLIRKSKRPMLLTYHQGKKQTGADPWGARTPLVRRWFIDLPPPHFPFSCWQTMAKVQGVWESSLSERVATKQPWLSAPATSVLTHNWLTAEADGLVCILEIPSPRTEAMVPDVGHGAIIIQVMLTRS